MSCKIVGGDADIQPLFSTVTASHTPQPLFDTGNVLTAGGSSEEVRVLQKRVSELEASVQRQVHLARDAGRQEGEAAGREMARSELQPVLERLSRSLAELATLRTRIRRDSESDLVKLSVCIARRILRRELTVDPEAVQGIVKAALDKVQAREIRKVRVHPDFQGVVRRQAEVAGVASAAEIVSDPSLKPGDVVVETRLGDLDATVESQLREIERGFADRLSR